MSNLKLCSLIDFMGSQALSALLAPSLTVDRACDWISDSRVRSECLVFPSGIDRMTSNWKPTLLAATAIVWLLLLQACGTTHATMRNKFGEDVMLLGHDPVAYFTLGQSVRGDPEIKTTLPGRTYYFVDQANKTRFLAQPEQYEPQYGGFCASGAAFALKLGSDPTEWQIVRGKLYIFGDILGHTAWNLDPEWNIEHGDEVWPEASQSGWRWQSLKRYAKKVPWYKNQEDIMREYAQKHPGKPWPKGNPGGMLQNLFFKAPGWRAREGFFQPQVGFVGEDACPPACPGQPSQGFVER
jgi:YHS domain-containing protein